MTQIAAISQDPWFSRVESPLDADYVALDLDPATTRRSARCSTSRAGFATSSHRCSRPPCRRRQARRAAHLHSAAAGTPVRVRHAVLPDRRDRDRGRIRTSRPSSAWSRRAARHGLRRLPAEHPRQDAGDRLQRARQRVRGRVDAAPWEEVDGRSTRTISPSSPRRRDSGVGDLWARLRRASPRISRRCSGSIRHLSERPPLDSPTRPLRCRSS